MMTLNVKGLSSQLIKKTKIASFISCRRSILSQMMKGSGEASKVVTFYFPTDQLIVKASVFSLTLLLAHHYQSKISVKIEMVGSLRFY